MIIYYFLLIKVVNTFRKLPAASGRTLLAKIQHYPLLTYYSLFLSCTPRTIRDNSVFSSKLILVGEPLIIPS